MPDTILGLVDILSKSKPPVVHWTMGHWRIWTAYNPSLTLGTYIELLPEGKLNRVTVRPDHTQSIQPL